MGRLAAAPVCDDTQGCIHLMKLNKKTLAVSTATLTLAAGAAFAWGYTGQGGGSASTVQHQPIEFRLSGYLDNIDQGEANAVDIPLEYENPNPSDVSGQDIVATVTGVTEPEGGTECTAEHFGLVDGTGTTFTANTNTWTEIPAGANPKIYALDTAPEACQGVNLDIEFTLTPTPSVA